MKMIKSTIIALTLAAASVSSANASPLAVVVDGLYHASVIGFGYMAKADENRDPRLFETVKARHNDDSGYEFTITKFEYDNAPDKYILVK